LVVRFSNSVQITTTFEAQQARSKMKAYVANVLGPKLSEGPRASVKWAVLEETGEGAIAAFVRAVPPGSEVAILRDTLAAEEIRRNAMRPGVAAPID
jgi:hypothetical protein